ncbi:MAG: hypothetical protein ACXWGS_13765, partial [Solirubrobacterales bacterium]
MGEEHRDGASEAWRKAMEDAAPPAEFRQQRGITPAEWVRDDEIEGVATKAVKRGRSGPAATRTGKGPSDAHGIEDAVRAELANAVGPSRVDKYEQRLKDASRAFEADRFSDAARMLRKLADDAPTAAAVRELF